MVRKLNFGQVFSRAYLRKAKYHLVGFTRLFENLKAKVNGKPIFILGNQKSGTTAIAALLARMAGLSVALDLRKEVHRPIIENVKKGDVSFESFVKRNKLDLSRELIKSTDLTFLFEELRNYFPEAEFVFIIRDPRANIRSTLDRLTIPGNQNKLTDKQWAEIPPAWRQVLDGKWLNLSGENYIEILAARWNFCADLYLKQCEMFKICKYEDFLKNKIGEIQRIAESLGLKIKNDISEYLDVEYQPKGRNKDAYWQIFFGDNFARINKICGERMRLFHYDPGFTNE